MSMLMPFLSHHAHVDYIEGMSKYGCSRPIENAVVTD
jgi:hypothetical protein